jgi:uncharacterized protein involved in response to NO
LIEINAALEKSRIVIPSLKAMSRQNQTSYLQLCYEEPFRIFFPLGVIVGLLGVSLWPLYFAGLYKFYPGVMHARLMMEGFMGAFIVGFLGTAGPRLTGTAHFSRSELWTLLGAYFGVVGMQIAGLPWVADAIFLVLLLIFGARMASRFSQRQDLPPPSFVLVGFGFLNAIAGTLLLLAGTTGPGYPRCVLLGSTLLNQGFVLYLVLGIGGFLLPRILKLPPKPQFPETRTIPPGWRAAALFAASIGVVLFASFVFEVLTGATRTAGFVRFLAAAIFLSSEIPAHRSAAPRLTIIISLRAALIFILVGLLFPLLWPAQRVAGLHIVFVGGFSLMTFTVATRVVLGHSGYSHLFPTRLPFLIVAAVLLVSGMALRVSGDFLPADRSSMLSCASYLWMFGAGVWGWRVLPKVRVGDPEE